MQIYFSFSRQATECKPSSDSYRLHFYGLVLMLIYATLFISNISGDKVKAMKLGVLAVVTTTLLSGCVVYVGDAQSGGRWSTDDLNHETRTLSLAASELTALEANIGAGSLTITGEAGRSTIEVSAEVYYIDGEDIRLSLQRKGDNAVLVAGFENGGYNGANPYIDVTIKVPAALQLALTDGSGSIDISGLTQAMDIEDGSGSINIDGGSDVELDDGSGEVVIRNLSGNVDIEDGSGSLTIMDVAGDVNIDDGSGGIDVMRVGGTVTINDGSGSILVDTAGGLNIIDDGSGGIDTRNIKSRL